MKKIILLMVVAFSGVMIAQAQETISDPNAVSKITPKQINELGQQSQNTNRNSSNVIDLDFEGLGTGDPINDFYNGGTSGQGYSGTNYGVQFGAALGLIDQDAGGTGNFANEPSPSTIMYFIADDQAYMNVPAGFTTGFSFYYSSGTSYGSVSVYDGINGTGNLLATINLASNGTNNCSGDPNGYFCHWDPIGVSFSGTAKSVVFAGAADNIGFDDITFGSSTPGQQPAVPISDWAIYFGIFLIGLFIIFRFRRRLV